MKKAGAGIRSTDGFFWKNDQELFSIIRKELYTAVIGDIMDKMGFLCQFLPPQIQPLEGKMRVVGRAMTVLEADILPDPVDKGGEGFKKPFDTC